MLSWLRRPRGGNSTSPNSASRLSCERLEGRDLLAAPVLDAIGNIVVPAAKSRIVPITASDSDGDALTYTVTSDNQSLVTELHRGNPYLRMLVRYTPQGQTATVDRELLFELLQDVAPNTVAKIVGLVNSGFYNDSDANPRRFYRVDPSFVIQGGAEGQAPNSNGFPFDDEFNLNAIFTGDAQLAMAKGGDDTNSSEFFVTLRQTRDLDFNHTIFGQLVRGRQFVTEIAAQTGTAFPNLPGSVRPTNPVRIVNASIVQNTTDAVVTVRSTSGATTSGRITVRVSDGTATAERTFDVSTATDSVNNQPFLGPVANVTTTQGTPITFRLTASDLENGPVTFEVEKENANDPNRVTISVVNDQVTLTPVAGALGTARLRARARQTGVTGTDEQIFTVTVTEAPPTPPTPPQPPLVDPNLPANQRFVAQTYQQILERPVDPAGLAHWSGMLARGVARTQVVAHIQSSQEYRVKVVTDLYQDVFNRALDSVGERAHTLFLQNGGTVEQLREALLSSEEYFQLQTRSLSSPADRSTAFLSGVYQDIFGRGIDTSGRETYTRMLGLGFERQEVIQTLLASDEARRHRADLLFQQILGRSIDSAAATEATAALGRGLSELALQADIVDSPEADIAATRTR